ncbi:MAG: Flp pilus assembly protein CpaB [Actinobacteria bacterium]|nr:Flp pilus assembly protein CpaB [Actinomycetota bacterium]
MKPRFVIIVVAVVLGAVAALGVNSYLNNVKKQVVREQKTIDVWVASQDIAKGTSIQDIEKNRLAELKKVPRGYVASQAISSARNIQGQVLSVPVSAGEQLTTGNFKFPSEAGLSYSIPKGHIAVSLPYDHIKGIAGMVKPGDLVTVFATLNPGPDGEDLTKILLQKVQVIAIGVNMGAEKEGAKAKAIGTAEASPNNSSDQKTITLALAPSDAEKIIFAQENGKIWFGLHPPTNAEAVATQGRTLKTILK